METLPQESLRKVQWLKFKRILNWSYRNSPFYRYKLDHAGVHPEDIQGLDDLRKIPLTEKKEWLAAQGKRQIEFASVLAVSESEIVRYHQTSGTTGTAVRLGFSHRDWNWWLECWGYGLAACNLNDNDRVLVCFPFNLFVGWWGGQDAARLLRCRVYSGGGMTTRERLQIIRDHEITALMGSPSYLLQLAFHAEKELGWQARDLHVRKLICGAEPGGSIPSTRKRLETAWGAEVFDHLGASEVGPWGYECSAHPGGVHIIEGFFLMEFLEPETMQPAQPGQLSRLVVTALEKYAQPVIRFDVKDLVRPSDRPCPCGRTFRWVEGGIMGRADDLIKLRGVLFSPQAVEDVVRSFDRLTEYRIIVSRAGPLDEVTLKAETRSQERSNEGLLQDLELALRLKTHLRFRVELCPPGTFPKEEIKTKRLIDLRKDGEESAVKENTRTS
ncbi:MAG: phenylacetate--CoA ligase family protein [Candidatus Binatia bacterium]